MPNHKYSNLNSNRIVINVNSNNKSKKQSTTAKPKSESATLTNPQSTYINNVAPPAQYNGTLDVDRSVAHGVQRINDQINILNDRREFLDAYEANLHGQDPANYRLNRSLGALNQHRINDNGSSESTLSLNHDNLESRSQSSPVGIGGGGISSIANSRSFMGDVRGVGHGQLGLNASEMPTDNTINPSEETEELIQPEKQNNSLLATHARRRARSEDDEEDEETMLANSAHFGNYNNPNRPTDPYGYNSEEEESGAQNPEGHSVDNYWDSMFHNLPPKHQLNVLKSLDSRNKTDKKKILKFAEEFVVDTTDDNNRRRSYQDIKNDIIRVWKDYNNYDGRIHL
jgi:hypothetical protein